MRWLLLKDLQILRRSPLQAVLLVAYPVLIAVLVGFAISPESSKPRVAFLNEIPSDSRVTVGGAQLPAIGVDDRICRRVDCIRVENRGEALDEVSSGDALAALILPPDLVTQINSLSTPTPGVPKVEVLVNEENPIKAAAVNDRISTLLAEANLLVAKRIAGEGSRFIDLLVNGGDFEVVGQAIEILGLEGDGEDPRDGRARRCPPGPLRDSLDRVIRFASLSGENLNLAAPLLDRLTQPIEVDKVVVERLLPPLDIFAIAVAATLTLAFVTVLLVAGSLALEREENAFPRLTRSLVSPSALLGEKVVLGIASGWRSRCCCSAACRLFVPLQWSRIGLWLAAILAGRAALGAAGAALGAAAREVRAVSLLAFMVTLPIAFLSLVPSGAVGKDVYDAIRMLVAVFPFKPALDAMTRRARLGAAPRSAGRWLHLAILTVAYGLIARLALRRFSSV